MRLILNRLTVIFHRLEFKAAVSLLLLLGACTPAIAELSEAQAIEINSIVKQAMEEAPYPAVSVIINQGGEDVYVTARGFSDLENQVPATVETVFAIGSITKSYTALATLMLIERGELKLEDTVASILPDYRGPGSQATVLQLLSHTSGIPNFLGEITEPRSTFERGEIGRERMISFFESEPLQFGPGEYWSYSNSGYYLLGIIIEQVSGLSYYTFLDKNIFQPFGLDATYSGDDSQLVPHRAHGYSFSDGEYRNAPPWYYLVPYSAGSLLSDTDDLVSYRRSVFHSDKVSKELLRLVTTTPALNNGEPLPYTLGGLISSEFHGHQKYSHSGEIYGFYSNHAYYPNQDLTIVILTNNKGTTPSPVWMERKMARVVMQIPQADVRDLQLPESDLDRYTGDYQSGRVLVGPKVYGFVSQDSRLYLRFGGVQANGQLMPLKAQGNGLFVMASDDEWQFQFEESSQPSSKFDMQIRDAIVAASRNGQSSPDD